MSMHVDLRVTRVRVSLKVNRKEKESPCAHLQDAASEAIYRIKSKVIKL